MTIKESIRAEVRKLIRESLLKENTGRVRPTEGVRKKLFEIGEDLNILLDMHVQDSSEPFLTDSEAKVINEARNIIINIARLDSYN